MAKNTTQTKAPAKTIAAKKEDGNQLMALQLPKTTKEGEVYLVVPEGTFGKERWFKINQMKKVIAGADGITVHLTRKELASRGILDHAKPVAA